MSTEAMQVNKASAKYLAKAEVQDVPPGYKRTEVGVIPEDWDTKRLGEVADIKSGATPSTNIASYWNGTIPWCTPTDITGTPGKYISATERSITEAGLAACAAGLLPVGSLLLCSRATIGEVKIAKTEICTNQGFKSLVCRNGIYNEFLYYLVLTLKPRMVERAIGSTFLEIGKRDLAAISIALPKENEQRTIAEALSDVDGLLVALEALIAKKRAIKQAAMQQLLTGKTRLPGFSGEWETKRLGDHAIFLRNGVNSRAELTADGIVKYLHYGDIHTSNQVRLDPRAVAMPSLPEERARTLDRLRDGDLVFVDASEDLDGVGKSVEISGVSDIEVVAGLHTIAARFDKSVLADGFKAYLQFCPAFRDQLRRLAAGTKVYATNRSHIASVEIRLPGIEEQTAIAAVLSDMEAEIAALEARRDKAKQIKQGMMQQLLTGRVRLVKPGDEQH